MEVLLKTDPDIEAKVAQSYTQQVVPTKGLVGLNAKDGGKKEVLSLLIFQVYSTAIELMYYHFTKLFILTREMNIMNMFIHQCYFSNFYFILR